MGELEGIIDVHLHPGPDVVGRSIDDVTLVREAERVGVRGVVLKSHFVPTMDRAWHASKLSDSVRVFGALTLSPFTGGLNPFAVRTALHHGAKIIWLPTLYSVGDRAKHGHQGGIVCVENGEPVAALLEIMELVEQAGAVLATGHLRRDEIFPIVETAVRRFPALTISLTHPDYMSIGLTPEDQRTLLELNPSIWFDRCPEKPEPDGTIHFSRIVKAIREVGVERTIISTDAGSDKRMFWSDTWRTYLSFLRSEQFTEEDIHTMARLNPAKLLGIETK